MGVFCYLLQFLASVLLAHVLVSQQHLQQLLHGLLRGLQLLLFKLGAANLMAERVDRHWDADRVGAVAVRNGVDRDLGSGK